LHCPEEFHIPCNAIIEREGIMRNLRYLATILGAVVVVGQVGCSNTSRQPTEEQSSTIPGRVTVYTANYPLKYFAERIGGEQVAVYFPAPADEDPAYWMPDAETISKYQQADLILLNGAGYEKWVDAVSLPKSKLCDTSAAFAENYVALEDAVTHSHGPEGQHAHGGKAFTTWLDPILAVKQAEAVRARLAKLRPEEADAFQRNYDALKTDLEELDRELADAVAKAPDRPVLFSHPVYQYFERRYRLNAKSVHWEPDETPTDAMWAELKGLLEAHPAKLMIWEGEPVSDTAAKLDELGLRIVVFDPCGNVPSEGDYLAAQRRNLTDLARIYPELP
jgi:zinc transport system substrate-binding protein